MEATTIREMLHLFIDMIEDKKAEAIYTLFEDEINEDVARRKIILSERSKYLRGEGKANSWQKVKEMAINKDLRNVL